jgi:hypothetical protein
MEIEREYIWNSIALSNRAGYSYIMDYFTPNGMNTSQMSAYFKPYTLASP